ncbi:MAG: acetoacetate--CoA ligase, partial [Candidatus Zixiibacteriota bacterium]
MAAFMRKAAERAGKNFTSYDDLYHWSVTEIESFWELIWREADIIHSKPYREVLNERVMPGAKWFAGAKLNFAENLLRHRNDNPAIVSWREDAEPVRLTYNRLYREVAACAAGLRKLGVTEGDRIAAFIPNIPEAIIAMLATTSIGALWSSCSPDFGLQGVLDRFGQIAPKVLFTANGYRYLGKLYNCLDKVARIAEQLPDLESIVVIPNTGKPSSWSLPRSQKWRDLLDYSADTITFAQLPFDHPVYIMYSSGTTGVPKCIIHGAGGTLLQHWKEHVLHTDLRPGEVISYYTTCG